MNTRKIPRGNCLLALILATSLFTSCGKEREVPCRPANHPTEKDWLLISITTIPLAYGAFADYPSSRVE